MRKMQLQHTAWILLAWVALSGAACQNVNPIAAAETNEQRAYAAYGTFVIFSEKAADIAELPSVPRNVKLALIGAEERAGPVADDLLDALLEFESIRDEFSAGTSTEERVLIASNNLNSWINRLLPLVNDLIKEVKGAE